MTDVKTQTQEKPIVNAKTTVPNDNDVKITSETTGSSVNSDLEQSSTGSPVNSEPGEFNAGIIAAEQEYKELFTVLKAKPLNKECTWFVDAQGQRFALRKSSYTVPLINMHQCTSLEFALNKTRWHLAILPLIIVEAGRHAMYYQLTDHYQRSYWTRSDIAHRFWKCPQGAAHGMNKLIEFILARRLAQGYWVTFFSQENRNRDSIWHLSKDPRIAHLAQCNIVTEDHAFNMNARPEARYDIMDRMWIGFRGMMITLECDERGFYFQVLREETNGLVDPYHLFNSSNTVIYQSRQRRRVPRISQAVFLEVINELLSIDQELKAEIAKIRAVASALPFEAEDFMDDYCGDQCRMAVKVSSDTYQVQQSIIDEPVELHEEHELEYVTIGSQDDQQDDHDAQDDEQYSDDDQDESDGESEDEDN